MKLNYKFTETFEILSKAVNYSPKITNLVKEENKIFRQGKKGNNITKIDNFEAYRPILLAGWDDFQTANWVEIINHPGLIRDGKRLN